jgi:hypothetical protein
MRKATRWTTAALLTVLALVFVLRQRLETITAADSESITWGADQPTWSPDGRRLAFTLFGSIWQAPAEGGAAEQVSNSSGYHAHPAWSPKGDLIAFIQGSNPRGRIPNTSGKLALVDVKTGLEREIHLPYPTAGSPSWSPDGAKIVCGLQVPGAGALLHEVDVSTGEVRRLQERPQRSAAGGWVDSAWSPSGREIFFAAQRMGEPQIWSMPADRKGFLVQMPLTAYKPEHIVLLDRLSATPDGSTVVYSAVEVNGKGDYEIYRVAREGGVHQAITDTARDELSPAVSPDGRTVALASNHLGNLDLFTMPIAGGEKKHVRLSELKFRGNPGAIRVKVLDEFGNPTPVRLYVEAADGKAYCPAGQQIFYYPLDPGQQSQGFFVSSGDDAFPVPAGQVRLTALKGIEYRIAERSVNVGPRQTAEVTLTLERWTNWAQRGWQTGENHFHANYNGGYYQKPLQSLAWLQAEDLNTANMIVANAAGAFIHDKEFFTGGVSSLSTDRYVLYWGQEYRNSDPLGHMGFLNIKQLVKPYYTSVIGSDSPYDFPLNTMAAQQARAQGALVTYMHPTAGTMNDVFDTGLGAKESVITAALGALDAMDVLPFGDPAYALWYNLLNCGFRIAPGGGTDAFTNWRGISRIPGGSRHYVHVGGKMDWDRWIARYREGRAFATNGPLLEFDVNGQPMGSEIRIPSGQSYRAKLTAQAAARVPLGRIEFIQSGNVIESRQVDPNSLSFRLEKEVEVTSSSWFAVRVSGPPARGVPDDAVPRAHSGPVYVAVDGAPTLVEQDLETAIRWVDRLWAYLVERDNFGPGDNRARAKEMIDQARQHYVQKLAQARRG